MLSLTVYLPLLGALGLLLVPAHRHGVARGLALASALAVLALVLFLWWGFEPGQGLQYQERREWLPSLGIAYLLGLDGVSLPLWLLTAVLVPACLLASWDEQRRVRAYGATILCLQSACLGLLAAQDLFLFYLFWNLALVAMYFLVALWGHADARSAALRFFLYSFVGSLALLLGIIGLYLGHGLATLELAELAAHPLPPGPLATLVFLALLLGFGIKLPLVPLHGWLPPAHTQAPAPGSALLAGVLLMLGGYGLLRVLLPLVPDTAARFGMALMALGLLSTLYAGLAALGQKDLKRLIAYLSIHHMGYVLLAVGVAARADTAAARLALNGAVLQMVSHGLVVASLFLLAGVLWRRARRYDLQAFGGLARAMPVYGFALCLAAFAALGLPGLSGFIAQFHILTAVFRDQPWAAALGLLGLLLIAAVFLWTLQRLLLGVLPERWRKLPDMHWYEGAAVLPLLALILLIGLAPAWILRVIDADATTVVAQLPP